MSSLLDKRSRYLRELIIRGLEGGRRGHIGSSMSIVEILRVLYDNILNFDPKNPKKIDRDRLILSKGHGCLALYSILADKGFFPLDELDIFCKIDSILGGHPDQNIPGVETTTGSLGHGFSIGLGIALALRIKNNISKVYIIVGDGEINEGSVWETCMSASKHRLDNLIMIIDNNKLQTYGSPEEVAGLNMINKKLESFGFETKEIDGHSIPDLNKAFSDVPFSKGKPNAIICNTIKGKGIDFAENNLHWHHKSSLSEEDIINLKDSIKKIK
mgnify:CR=1 FL=1